MKSINIVLKISLFVLAFSIFPACKKLDKNVINMVTNLTSKSKISIQFRDGATDKILDFTASDVTIDGPGAQYIMDNLGQRKFKVVNGYLELAVDEKMIKPSATSPVDFRVNVQRRAINGEEYGAISYSIRVNEQTAKAYVIYLSKTIFKDGLYPYPIYNEVTHSFSDPIHPAYLSNNLDNFSIRANRIITNNTQNYELVFSDSENKSFSSGTLNFRVTSYVIESKVRAIAPPYIIESVFGQPKVTYLNTYTHMRLSIKSNSGQKAVKIQKGSLILSPWNNISFVSDVWGYDAKSGLYKKLAIEKISKEIKILDDKIYDEYIAGRPYTTLDLTAPTLAAECYAGKVEKINDSTQNVTKDIYKYVYVDTKKYGHSIIAELYGSPGSFSPSRIDAKDTMNDHYTPSKTIVMSETAQYYDLTSWYCSGTNNTAGEVKVNVNVKAKCSAGEVRPTTTIYYKHVGTNDTPVILGFLVNGKLNAALKPGVKYEFTVICGTTKISREVTFDPKATQMEGVTLTQEKDNTYSINIERSLNEADCKVIF